MKRRLYRKARRIRRNFDPVVLGQNKAGFILAAVLILLWWVGTDANAELTNPGHSENDYFRLEWNYDLTQGEGYFIIQIKDTPEGNIYNDVRINSFNFTTIGEPYTSILEASGKDTRYIHNPLGTLHTVTFPSVQFHAEEQTQLQFNMTFPTNGIAFLPTQLSLSAYTALGGHTPPMEFLAIQTIPEPSSIASLFLGAAGVVGGLWRKEKKD